MADQDLNQDDAVTEEGAQPQSPDTSVADQLHIAGKGFDALDDGTERGNDDPIDPAAEDEVFGNANIQSGRRNTFEQMVAGQPPEGETLSDQTAIPPVDYQGSEPDSTVDAAFEAPQPAAAGAPNAPDTDIPDPAPRGLDEETAPEDGPPEEDPAPRGRGNAADPAEDAAAPPAQANAAPPAEEAPPLTDIQAPLPEAEPASLAVQPSNGTEDLPLKLELLVASGDTDGAETVLVTLTDVPVGFTFVDGDGQPVGTTSGTSWSFTLEQANDLWLVRPDHWSGDLEFGVQVVSTETTGESVTVSASLPIHVEAVADAPVLAAEDLALTEGEPVPLDITAGLVDADGSESLMVYVAGLPDGATLTHGTRLDAPLTVGGTTLAAGTWAVDPADLGDLGVTLPATWSDDLNLQAYAATTEAMNGDAALAGPAPIHVDIGVRAPAVEASGAGDENLWTDLDLTAAVVSADGSETLTVLVEDLPADAELRRADTGAVLTPNGDGAYDVTGLTDQLQVRWKQDGAAAHSDADITLSVRAIVEDADVGTANESARDTNQTVVPVTVAVAAVADGPAIAAADVGGLENSWIDIPVDTLSITDRDGSESLSVYVEGVPAGAELRLGHGLTATAVGADVTLTSATGGTSRVLSGDGTTWRIDIPDAHTLSDSELAARLSTLQVRPAEDSAADMQLNLVAVTTEANGAADHGQAEQAWAEAAVHVDVGTRAAVVTAPAQTGAEDTWTPLDDTFVRPDAAGSFADKVVTVTLSGLTDGAVLGHTDGAGGFVAFAPAASYDVSSYWNAATQQLDGLAVRWTADNASGTITGTLEAVVEDPDMAPGEDADAIGSTPNARGDGIADATRTTTSFSVEVIPTVDDATVVLANSGLEDAGTPATVGDGIAVTPAITLSGDTSESLDGAVVFRFDAAEAAKGDLTWSGDPALFTVSADGLTYTLDSSVFIDDGSGSLVIDPAAGALSFVPTEHLHGTVAYDFDFTVRDGDQTRTFAGNDGTIAVTAVADDAVITTGGAGAEDSLTGAIDVNLAVQLIDIDGSESLTGTIDIAFADGAATPGVLQWSDGSPVAGDGAGGYSIAITDSHVSLDPATGLYTVSGLTFVPTGHSDVDVDYTVSATVVDADNQPRAVTPVDGTVTVAAIADDPTLANTADVGGLPGEWVTIGNGVALGDPDGSETLTLYVKGVPADGDLRIEGSPAGITVTRLGAGASVTLTSASGFEADAAPAIGAGDFRITLDDPSQLADLQSKLQVYLPEGGSDDLSLDVVAVSTETMVENATGDYAGQAEQAWTVDTVHVDVGVHAPTVVGHTDVGSEGTWTQLDSLQVALDNRSGSAGKAVTVTLEGVPAAAAVGVVQGDGSVVTLTPVDASADPQVYDVSALWEAGRLDELAVAWDDPTASGAIEFTLKTRVEDADFQSGDADNLAPGADPATGDGTPDVAVATDSISVSVDPVVNAWTISASDSGYEDATRPDGGDGTIVVNPVITPSADASEGLVAGSVVTFDFTAHGDAAAGTLSWQATPGNEGLFVDNGDGTYTLAASAFTDNGAGGLAIDAALGRLVFTPPADSDYDAQTVDYAMTMQIVDNGPRSGGAAPTATVTMDGSIDIIAVADALTIGGANVGDEGTGTTISLTPSIQLQDTDGSEHLVDGSQVVLTTSDSLMAQGTLRLGGVVQTAQDNGDGTWSYIFSEDDLTLSGDTYTFTQALTFEPAAHHDDDLSYTLTATVEDNGGVTRTSTGAGTIEVRAVADAPTLTAADTGGFEHAAGAGAEEGWIPLPLSGLSMTDVDGSESFSVYIENVPAGAQIRVDGASPLVVTADVGSVSLSGANGTSLDIADGRVFRIDVPNAHQYTPAELTALFQSLEIRPADTSSADMDLTVVAVTTEADNGQQAWASDSLHVDVGVVDPVIGTRPDIRVAEGDTWAALGALPVSVGALSTTDLAALTGGGAEETVTITVTQLPDGAQMRHVAGDGTVTTFTGVGPHDVTQFWDPAQGTLDGLQVQWIDADQKGPIEIGLQASIVDLDQSGDFDDFDTGSAIAGDGARDQSITTVTDVITVHVDPRTDSVTVQSSAVGVEDQDIPLNLTVTPDDTSGTETVSAASLTGLPTGAKLFLGGVLQGESTGVDQVFTLDPTRLGDYSLRAPADSHDDFTLKLSVETTDSFGGQDAVGVSVHDVPVTVYADADTPTLVADADSGTAGVQRPHFDVSEDGAKVQLTWGAGGILSGHSGEGDAGFPDSLDTSEHITVRIQVGSAGHDNGDAQVFVLNDEGQYVAATYVDTSGAWSDVQAGGGSGGYWEVDGQALADGKVYVAGAEDFGDGDTPLVFDLTPVATEIHAAAEGALPDGLSREISRAGTATQVELDIAQLIDTFTPTAANAGVEDQAIWLTPRVELTDTDGSELLTGDVRLDFDATNHAQGHLVWEGDTAAHFTDLGNGAYTISADAFTWNAASGAWELTDPQSLKFVPDDTHSDDTVTYGITATVEEDFGGSAQTLSGTGTITRSPDADAVTPTATHGRGMENTAIAFDIDVSSIVGGVEQHGLIDTDGSETLTVYISGVPEGAVLAQNGTEITGLGLAGVTIEKVAALHDGSSPAGDIYRVTFDGVPSPASVDSLFSNLTVTPPANDSQDFTMTVTTVVDDRPGDADADREVRSADILIDVGTNAPSVTTDGAVTVNEDSNVRLTVADLKVENPFPDSGEALHVFLKPELADGSAPNASALRVQVLSGGKWVNASYDPALGWDVSDYLAADQSNGSTQHAIRIVTGQHADADVTVQVTTRIRDEDLGTDRWDADGATAANDEAYATDSFTVTVKPVADAPTVRGGTTVVEADDSQLDGNNVQWVDLPLTITVRDADSETISKIELRDVPEGTFLGIDDGSGVEDFASAASGYTVQSVTANGLTTYTFTPTEDDAATLLDHLRNHLKVGLPDDSSDDITFTLYAQAEEHGTDGGPDANRQYADATATVTVDVYGVADTPTLSLGTNAGAHTIGEDAFFAVDWSQVAPASGENTGADGSETVQAYKIWPAAGQEDLVRVALAGPGEDPADHLLTKQPGGWYEIPADLGGKTLYLGGAENWSSTDPTGADVDLTFNVSVVYAEADSADGRDTGIAAVDSRAGSAESAAAQVVLTVTPTGDVVSIITSGHGVEDQSDHPDFGGEHIAVTARITSEDSSEQVQAISLSTTDPTMAAGNLYRAGGGLIAKVTSGGTTTWTLDPSDVDADGNLVGIGFDPVEHSSADVSYALHVTMVDSDGTTTSSASVNGTITIDAVADAPEARVDAPTNGAGAIVGVEDHAIPLDLHAALVDTDGSESMVVEVLDVPDGWQVGYWDGTTFTAASPGDDNSWTIDDHGRLDEVALWPPTDYHVDAPIDMRLRVTSQEDGGQGAINPGDEQAVNEVPFSVVVTPEADAPSVVARNVTVAEDGGEAGTPVALNIIAKVTDIDSRTAAEVIDKVRLEGDFQDGTLVDANGAVIAPLSDDGTTRVYEFTAAEAAAVRFMPYADSNDDLTLTVTAFSKDGDSIAQTQTTMTVTVTGTPDAVTKDGVRLGAGEITASGVEDTLIDPGFGAYGTEDADGSETLSIVIRDIPNDVDLVMVDGSGSVLGGAALEGKLSYIGGGRWAVAADAVGDVRFRVPGDYAGDDYTATVDFVVTENDGASAVTTRTLRLDVLNDADGATIGSPGAVTEDAHLATGSDAGIPLSISVTPKDTTGGAEQVTEIRLTVDVDQLSAGGEDRWLEIDGAAVTPAAGATSMTLVFSDSGAPGTYSLADWTKIRLFGVDEDSARDFTVGVQATTTDIHGDTHQSGVIAKTLRINAVTDDPDTFTATAGDLNGDKNARPLDITLDLGDQDLSEGAYLQITGVPDGMVLTTNAGQAISDGQGTWFVPYDDDPSWTVTAHGGPNVSGDLTIKAVITDYDVDTGAAAASKVVTIGPVHVDFPADAGGVGGGGATPSLDVLVTADAKEDEAFGLTVSVDPDGATASALVIHDLNGATLVANLKGGAPGAKAFYVTDGGDYVIPLNADGTIPLNGDGTPVVLIQPPHDMAGPLQMSLSVTGTSGTSMVSSWTGVGDPPLETVADLVETSDGAGVGLSVDQPGPYLEDAHADGLDVTLTLTRLDTVTGVDDAAEELKGGTVTLTADDLPAGGALWLNGTELSASAGPWTIDLADFTSTGSFTADGTLVLEGLTFVPPAQWDGTLKLSAAVTAGEAIDGVGVTSSGSVNITLGAVADTEASGIVVDAGVAAGVTPTEDQAIALDLRAFDPDRFGAEANGHGSEFISVVLKGVPANARVTNATNNGMDDDGTYSWTIKDAQIDRATGQISGVSILPEENWSGDMSLTLTVYSMESADRDTVIETSSDAFTVSVQGVADTPSINPQSAVGVEDQPVAIELDAELADLTGETLAVTITDVPAGATFTDGGDPGTPRGTLVSSQGATTTWTFTATELAGLHFVGPANASGTFKLNAFATSSEDGTTATSDVLPLTIRLAGDPDAPDLTAVTATNGVEDDAAQRASLDISAALNDSDGETLSLRLFGANAADTFVTADGRVVQATDEAGTPVWTITADEAQGLRYVPGTEHVNGTVSLQVVARSTENGQWADSAPLDVSFDIAAVNDAPTISFDITDARIVSGNVEMIRAVPEATGDGSAITFADTADGMTDMASLSVSLGGVPGGEDDMLAVAGLPTQYDPGTGTTSVTLPYDMDDYTFALDWDAGSRTLTFTPTDGPAPADLFEQLAEKVVLSAADGRLNNGGLDDSLRTVTFTVTDSEGASTSRDASITLDGTVTLGRVDGTIGDDSFYARGATTLPDGVTIFGGGGMDTLFLTESGGAAYDWTQSQDDPHVWEARAVSDGHDLFATLTLEDAHATHDTSDGHDALVFEGSGTITFEDNGQTVLLEDIDKVAM